MAFNVGAFVGGMFDGFKGAQDILKARNDLYLQGLNIAGAESAYKDIEAGKGTDDNSYMGVQLYPGAAAGTVPGSGSSTPPVEPGAGGPGGYGGGQPDRADLNRRGSDDPEAANKIADVLKDAGINHAGISGVLGWLTGETVGFNPYGHNDIKGGHTGMFQWDDKIRWPQYVNDYLPKHGGGDPYDRVNQMKYWLWEQEHTSESKYGVLEGLRNAKTPEEANTLVGLSQRAEKPNLGLDMARHFYWNGYGPKPAVAAAPSALGRPVDTGASGDIDAQAGGGTPAVKPATPAATPAAPAPAAPAAPAAAEPNAFDPAMPDTAPAAPTRALTPAAALAPAAAAPAAPAPVPTDRWGQPAPPGYEFAPAGPDGKPRYRPIPDAPGGTNGIVPSARGGAAQGGRPPGRTSALSGGSGDLFNRARRAPDGRDYVPDPNRPGKYLMVSYG